MKSFARTLVLRQRQTRTRKWAIVLLSLLNINYGKTNRPREKGLFGQYREDMHATH